MKKVIKSLLIFIAFLILIGGFFYFRYKPKGGPEWGLTFSYQEATGLGFDPKFMYADILADLKPKNLRLMTYWKDAEKTPGDYDFSMVDWQLELAQKNNIDVLLVLGRKQPRWPECSEPDWVKKLAPADQDAALLAFLKNSVEHFKSFPAISHWQVENEPFFDYGPLCPVSSKELFTKEVNLVRQLDGRPIVVTDSGERGWWFPAAGSGGDILGATVYRVSYDTKFGGYYKYPIPGIFYRVKAGILETFTQISDVWDVELQMEPWFTKGAFNMPLDMQKSLMNAKVFAGNIEYAKDTDLSRHYLWGVEWWYWMALKQNDWGMWTAGKELFSKN